MYPRVSIIILNWNGWKDTIECLESVYQITYPNYDVIVVDNGSSDESIEKIKEYCEGKIKVESKFFEYSSENKPIKIIEYTREEAEAGGGKEEEISKLPSNRKLILIKNEKNYGFAEGNNIGIRYALKTLNPDYVLLLNNDTVVDREFLKELVKVGVNEEKVGLIQPKLLYYDDPNIINNTGLLCDIFGATLHRGRYEKDEGQYDNLTEKGFFYASGACLLVQKEFLYELGGECFDKFLFAYHEDVDLSWQARLLGFRVIYCPRSICFHKEGKSSGRFNPTTAYWGYRNRIRVLMKNYSIKYLIWVLPIAILLEFLMSTLVSIYRKDFRYFYSFLKALVWNIKIFGNTLKMRRFVQSKRKVEDKHILRYMEHNSIECRFLLKKFHQVISQLIRFPRI
ncbi:glycosyltransferase [Thermococcus sp. 101 C5]|uniref:glycosyltransferase family 2 protein n=1 Tax=Thermococcus sp. 101 C5 TaxID=2654197 RepID=UPI00128B435D|nr:glycosyltransferase family 2 protein [Thermococcus sp. 101 C5]MPW38615.1 glycosyltransferase [Thermococcus sp. 101 C5]